MTSVIVQGMNPTRMKQKACLFYETDCTPLNQTPLIFLTAIWDCSEAGEEKHNITTTGFGTGSKFSYGKDVFQRQGCLSKHGNWKVLGGEDKFK